MDKSNFGYHGIATDVKNGPPPSYTAAAMAPVNVGGGRSLAEPPAAFYVKKWILLVTMFFNIVGLFIGLFCVDFIVEVVIARSVATGSLPSDSDEEMRSTIKTVTYVLLVFCIAIEGLFFYGVAKHHLGLTTGYTVLSILGTLSMLIGCLVNPAKLLDTLVIAFIACVSWSFMKDLRTLRDNRIRMGLNVI